MDSVTPRFLTAALYQFVDLPDFAALQGPLQSLCDTHGVRGMLLLAPEGINGTIAGEPQGVHAVLAWLRSDARFAALQHKEALAERMPFYRMRVRLKREIVTLGVPGLNPARNAGTYVKPEDWNALIDDPGVVVVDTRNDYEVGIGTFERAINPYTQTFAEFPAWVAQQSQPGGVLAGKPRVAMFCTGGIRCEKSTAFLKSQGFRRGVPPRRRHPQIPGNRARRLQPLAWRLLCVRRTRVGRPRPGARPPPAVPILPHAAGRSRTAVTPLRARRELPLLPRHPHPRAGTRAGRA